MRTEMETTCLGGVRKEVKIVTEAESKEFAYLS